MTVYDMAGWQVTCSSLLACVWMHQAPEEVPTQLCCRFWQGAKPYIARWHQVTFMSTLVLQGLTGIVLCLGVVEEKFLQRRGSAPRHKGSGEKAVLCEFRNMA